MAHYTVYWKPGTVDANYRNDVLAHSASDQLRKVAVGDVLWILSSRGFGDLLLINRQRVDRIRRYEELSDEEADRLWRAQYHVYSDAPEVFICVDISDVAPRLRFEGTIDRLPTEFSGRNFQTVRRLTPDAVRLMEQTWSARKPLGKEVDPASRV